MEEASGPDEEREIKKKMTSQLQTTCTHSPPLQYLANVSSQWQTSNRRRGNKGVRTTAGRLCEGLCCHFTHVLRQIPDLGLVSESVRRFDFTEMHRPLLLRCLLSGIRVDARTAR